MVAAQYDLVKNHLGIDHLRLVMGNSMGGMLTWLWGVTHPGLHGCSCRWRPSGPMSGRNWMMRRMLIDAVRSDPAWDGGNYKEQPPNLAIANVWYAIATSNGEKRLAKIGDTGEAADAYVDERLAEAKRRMPTTRCTSGARPATSIRAPTSARSRRSRDQFRG